MAGRFIREHPFEMDDLVVHFRKPPNMAEKYHKRTCPFLIGNSSKYMDDFPATFWMTRRVYRNSDSRG